MITIKQGEDYKKYLHLQYADTLEPVNLSGWMIRSEMRDVPGGTLKATGECTSSPADGDITIHFSSAQTSAIEPGKYGFDVWLTGYGEKHPIYTKQCVIVKSYTEM